MIVPEIISGVVDPGVGGMAAGGPDRRLGVERVEDRLDQQHVDAALDEAGDLLAIGLGQLAERHRAVSGILDLGRQRQRDVGRPDRAGDPALAAVGGGRGVDGAAGEPGAGDVDLVDQRRVVEAVLALGDGGRRERVGA